MRDLYSNIAAQLALAPAAALEADTTGAAVDTRDATGLVFIITTGAATGAGKFTATLEESVDGENWQDAPAAVVRGAGDLVADAVRRVGYVGYEKFARLKLTKTGTATLFASAVAVKDPRDKPVA